MVDVGLHGMSAIIMSKKIILTTNCLRAADMSHVGPWNNTGRTKLTRALTCKPLAGDMIIRSIDTRGVICNSVCG